MGVCTFLVSDSTKEYFDFGNVFLEEYVVLAAKSSANVKATLRAWLRGAGQNFNNIADSEIDDIAELAAWWMRAHADWRFISEADEDFDDIYLAEDREDEKDYIQEFGKEAGLIYCKTGSINDTLDNDD